jgi:asparagine synthase (glutamine-hydrolysing)
MPLHSVPLRAENVLDELGAFIRMHGVPLADLAFPNDLALLHLAAREGCGALFTGDGSDEVSAFSWAWVADLIRSGRWLRLGRTLSPYARYHGRAPLYLLKNSLRYAVPRGLLHLWKRGKWSRAPEWVQPEFARRSGLLERLRATPEPGGFRSMSAREDYVTLTRGRRVLVDERREREASRLGVEYRFPFYDTRMLEFMFAVPWEEKVDGWQVKPFLRQAPGLLPEALQRAGRKANYLAYGERLWQSQQWNSLRPLFESPPRGAEEYVHLPVARQIAQEFLDSGHRSQRETFLALAVFLLWRSTET